MTRFAIFVTLQLKPGSAEAFKPHILENAAAAPRDEPECHHFSVHQAEDDPDKFHFYEVYSNAASLDYHREQPHYKKFIAATKDMILSRDIQRLTVINP